VVGQDSTSAAPAAARPTISCTRGAARFPPSTVIEKVEAPIDGRAEVVSSSAIRRAALERGDVEAAARGLGRDYVVAGIVAPGQRIGRQLGVPTANLALELDQSARLRRLRGSGGGRRPDLRRRRQLRRAADGQLPGAPLLEVHLFDFSGDLYGQEMDSRVSRPAARGAQIRFAPTR